MKYCHLCGRPLQDNEICSCRSQYRSATGERYVSPAYQQPSAPEQRSYTDQSAQRFYSDQPRQNTGMDQMYYSQPVKKASDDKFVKSLKNFPTVFKSFWTGSDKLERDAKKSKDWILPLMFIWGLFFANLFLAVCYFARMSDSTGNYSSGLGMFRYVFISSGQGFQFGFVLLTALIITAFSAFLYVGSRFAVSMIFAKKKPLDALLDAVIEFGLHSMPICLWLLLGTLMTLATSWLTVPFIGFAMAYYIVIGVLNTIKESAAFKNVFVRNIIVAGFVTVCVALLTWMFFLCCQMNVGITSVLPF